MISYEEFLEKINKKVQKNQSERGIGADDTYKEILDNINKKMQENGNQRNLSATNIVPTKGQAYVAPIRKKYTVEESANNISNVNLPVANEFKEQLATGKRVQVPEEYSTSAFKENLRKTALPMIIGSAVDNIKNDTGNVLSNLLIGLGKSGKQSTKYIESANENNFADYKNKKTAQYMTSLKVPEQDKALFRQQNDVLIPKNLQTNDENKIETNLTKRFLQESIDKDNEKIQSNIDTTTNPIMQKLAQLAPSIGQSAYGLVASSVNPILGTSAFMSSAGGEYIDDAKQRGMNSEEAFKYGTIMGALEGGTESVGAHLTKQVGKNIAKNSAKQAVKAFALDIAENVAEEAIMEPLSELTAKAVAGDEHLKYDYSTIDGWKQLGKDMVESGIDGGLTAIIMGGASAGIGSSVNLVNKLTKGEKISSKEINIAKQDVQNRLTDIEVQQKIQDAQAIINQFNDISNLKQNVQNNQSILPTQQINQEQNKMSQNGNMEQIQPIANNSETLYNNIGSEGGINEQLQRQGILESNGEQKGIYENSKLQQKEYTRTEYEQWERAIKPITETDITVEQKTIKNNIKRQYNKDIVFFDGNNNGNAYSGGVSYNNSNKIYIDTRQTETFGLNKMVYHEILESDILSNTKLYNDTLRASIEKIMNDPDFQEQKNIFWNGQENNMPNDYLIAKDILCDRFAELKTGEKLDYNNVLSQETNMNIDFAIDSFYKQIYGKELKNDSSFNLPNNSNQDNNNSIAPTKDYFENIQKQQVLSDDDLNVLNKIYEKEGKTEILSQKKKASLLDKYISDKYKFKDSFDMLAQKIVNKGHYVDKLAESSGNLELKYMYDRNLNSFAEAQYTIGVAQTDNNGNAIGKSINDIWKPVEDSNLTKEFSEYMLHKLNVDRAEKNKYIFGEDIKPADSTRIALDLEAKYPEFKEYAKDIKNFNHNNLMNLKDAGLVSQETIDYLEAMYPNYVPISRAVEEKLYTGSNEKTGTMAPIKKAVGGNSNIQPLKDSMAEQAIRMKKLINENHLGQELSKSLKNAKVEDVVDITVTPAVLMETDTLVETDGNGNKFYTYFEDGKLQKLKINDELYESLRPTEISKIEKTLPFKAVQKATNINRSLLTSSNPLFVVTNFFKDLQDGMFNSKYSSKFIKNYGKALNEIITRGKYYESYMANGGMTNSYFDYESGVKKKSNKFVEKIRSANEIVEQLPRLTEFISTLEAGKGLNEAMYNAAEITTNFKRGGEWAKTLNRNGATFLNASIQGFDKFYRNFSGQNGAKGYANLALKATLLGVAPAILNHMLLGDDEDYQRLSQSEKDLYYLFKYDDGKFIRIPKGRMLSIFGSVGRRSVESVQGQDDAWDGFGNTVVNQIAPNNPMEDNILAPITAVANNKTWYGSDLVSSRLQKELPKNQYDETTDEFSKWLGNTLNISPKKINYLIDQYSGGIGDVLLPMITPQAKENVVIDKFTTDSVLKNKNVSKFYETLEKQNQIVNDSFSTDKDRLELKYLNEMSSEISKLYKEKREIQMSNISQDEKKKKVREIQSKIDNFAEDALNNYKDVKVDGNTATTKYTSFYKNGKGQWEELTDTEKEKNKNISLKTFADYKNRIYDVKQNKIKSGELKNSQDLKDKDKIQVLLDSNYSNKEISALYENYILKSTDKKYSIIKESGIDVKEYLKYAQQNFESDKINDGTIKEKSVRNSKRVKEYEFVKNMNISYNQRLLILGLNYKLNDTERSKLAYYINDLDLSKAKKLEAFLKIKGFTVYKDGRIKW